MTHAIFNMSAGDKNDLFRAWISPESILLLAKEDAESIDILEKGEAHTKKERISLCMMMFSRVCKQPSVLAYYMDQIIDIYGGW